MLKLGAGDADLLNNSCQFRPKPSQIWANICVAIASPRKNLLTYKLASFNSSANRSGVMFLLANARFTVSMPAGDKCSDRSFIDIYLGI